MPVNAFIRDNAKWLLVVLFTAGSLYSEMKTFRGVEANLQHEIETQVGAVKQRLDKKIKIIEENKETIHSLEVRVAVLETLIKCNNQ